MPETTDRQLLFGLLAARAGLIRDDDLVAALRAWAADKDRPLDEHLMALGCLKPGQKSTIDALVDLHVEVRRGDIGESLGSIPLDAATRAEIAAALAAADDDATTTDPDPAADPDATTAADPAAEGSGGQSAAAAASRFRILRPFARGGLGAVYVALDSELNREVALKQILEGHADNPVSRGRFLVEAEITGGLEHPGIVPVYGLGAYGDGRPYYAMRFVRGETLRDAIEAFHARTGSGPGRSLEFRRLLRKFTDVCNTIGYAHSRGVLHRDVKPANVIVGKHGETLVVDWGLAKALGRTPDDAEEGALTPSSGSGSALTLEGRAMGTPAYMSPEQARGELENLGPPADVYSLGATLFQVLTGRAPFEGSTPAVLEAVEAGDFPRPRTVDAAIDPALEAIVLKAMAKEPADRYASARALADDVDRWLADERVEAHAEPWTRTLNRWLTRHRTGVTGAAAAGLVAIAALGIISVSQSRANAALKIQRERAEANETEAIEAVKRFKDAIADNPELKSNPELDSLRKTLLKEPLAFFGRLRERLQVDGDVRPESLYRLADAAHAHGVLIVEIGDKAAAVESLRQSLEIYERLIRDHPDIAKLKTDLGQVHNNLGNLLHATGQIDEARTAFGRAIEIDERLVRDHPDVADHRARLAKGRNNLGLHLLATGQIDEARAAFGRAIEIAERLAGEHPDIAQYRADLASVHNNLGNLLRAMGRLDEARAAHGRAIAIDEGLARDHPDRTEHQADLISSLVNLGNLLRDMNRLDEAATAYGRVVEIGERLARDHPAVSRIQNDLASGHGNLGLALLEIGRLDEARPAMDRAIEIGERLVRNHPNEHEPASALGVFLHNRAMIDLQDSRFAEARERILAAIDRQRRALGSNPENPQPRRFLEGALDILVRAERGLGHEEEAARAQRELVELRVADPSFAAVEARLKAVMKGEAPRDNDERLALAGRAYDTSRFHAAANLWDEVFKADPALADDRQFQRPYNAACAAALAAAGEGSEPPGDDAEKARLRGRALGWLKVELAAWTKLLESAQPEARQAIAATLRHWRTDPDLAGVRDPDALAKLPEPQRAAWSGLWREVDQLLAGGTRPAGG